MVALVVNDTGICQENSRIEKEAILVRSLEHAQAP